MKQNDMEWFTTFNALEYDVEWFRMFDASNDIERSCYDSECFMLLNMMQIDLECFMLSMT